MPTNDVEVPPTGPGRTPSGPQPGLGWDNWKAGDSYRTGARTIGQADIVSFVAHSGFVESLFLDLEYVRESTPYGRRIAPGILTLAMAEGLVIQSGLLRDTAIALLGLDVRFAQPVFEDDTIHVVIEVQGSRPTSAGPDRGVVTTRNAVVKQDGVTAMEYDVVRLLGKAPPPPG